MCVNFVSALQYSGQENPMDCLVQGVAKSRGHDRATFIFTFLSLNNLYPPTFFAASFRMLSFFFFCEINQNKKGCKERVSKC